mmetsp:Transcript_52056/g.127079  ORF Transcript_52056/g.127079 Transcript_52056/m.127079 type:complete len:481 (-) Transcript_52056:564-2006(-)
MSVALCLTGSKGSWGLAASRSARSAASLLACSRAALRSPSSRSSRTLWLLSSASLPRSSISERSRSCLIWRSRFFSFSPASISSLSAARSLSSCATRSWRDFSSSSRSARSRCMSASFLTRSPSALSLRLRAIAIWAIRSCSLAIASGRMRSSSSRRATRWSNSVCTRASSPLSRDTLAYRSSAAAARSASSRFSLSSCWMVARRAASWRSRSARSRCSCRERSLRASSAASLATCALATVSATALIISFSSSKPGRSSSMASRRVTRLSNSSCTLERCALTNSCSALARCSFSAIRSLWVSLSLAASSRARRSIRSILASGVVRRLISSDPFESKPTGSSGTWLGSSACSWTLGFLVTSESSCSCMLRRIAASFSLRAASRRAMRSSNSLLRCSYESLSAGSCSRASASFLAAAMARTVSASFSASSSTRRLARSTTPGFSPPYTFPRWLALPSSLTPAVLPPSSRRSSTMSSSISVES